MAQKNATPTKAQQEAIRKAGHDPALWRVKKELPSSLIIIHHSTGKMKLVDKVRSKQPNPKRLGM